MTGFAVRWAERLSLAFIFLYPITVNAGAFTVSPVRVELSQAQRSVAMNVRNEGNSPAVIQIRVMTWSQRDGADEFTETDEIIATPPIVTIPSGQSQIVRYGLRREPDPVRELAYRVFLQETPGPPKPGFQGLQLALRLSVPIFVEAKTAAAPQLQWSAFPEANGLAVRLVNVGGRHVQIHNMSVSKLNDEAVAYSDPTMVYVLPGASHVWHLHTSDRRGASIKAGERLLLTAGSDAGDVSKEMLVEQP